jgi:hypothetical protein
MEKDLRIRLWLASVAFAAGLKRAGRYWMAWWEFYATDGGRLPVVYSTAARHRCGCEAVAADLGSARVEWKRRSALLRAGLRLDG